MSAALAIAAGAAGSAPSFGRAQNYATGPGPTSLAIGDMNGDHKPDLATANGDATSVSVLLNKGRGRFEARRDYPTGGGPLSVAIADLNADGKPDLATANSGAETVSVLLNKGDGSFLAKRDYPRGVRPVSLASGDLDGDGTPDLATANAEVNRPSKTTKPNLVLARSRSAT